MRATEQCSASGAIQSDFSDTLIQLVFALTLWYDRVGDLFAGQ